MEFIRLLFSQTSIHFKNLESSALFFISGISLLLILTWAYLKINGITKKQKIILLIFKSIAFIILFLYFASPVVEYRYEEIIPSETLVLLDTSSSMSVRADKEKSIGQTVMDVLAPYIKKPGNNEHKFVFLSADSGKTENLSEDHNKFEGCTDLSSSLDFAIDQRKDKKTSNIILISDGVNTFGENLELYSALSKIPINTVFCSPEKNPKDIAINKIITASKGYLQSPHKLEAIISQTGYESSRFPVNLYKNDILIQTRTVSLSPNTPEAKTEFEFVENESGEFLYKISIPDQEGELIAENNKSELYIPFISSKVKILLASSKPSYDFSFISRGLKTFEDFEVTTTLILSKAKILIQNGIKSADYDLSKIFSRNNLSSYDIIIFSSLEANTLTEKQIKEIENTIVNDGTGFIMTGGDGSFSEGGWNNTTIGNILPFNLISSRDYKNNPIQITPSQTGLSHPITKLSPTPRVTKFLWGDFPGFSGYHQVLSNKPLTTVLLEESSSGFPLAGIHKTGKGKTGAILFNSIYKMDFYMNGIGRNNENFLKFLTNLIHYLKKQENSDFLSLNISKMNYRVFEPVNIKVTATDENFNPDTQLNIKCGIWHQANTKDNPQIIAEMNVPITNKETGLYETEWIPEKIGYYEIKILKDNVLSETNKSKKIIVTIPPEEFNFNEKNKALLTKTAQNSGGKDYNVSDLAQLLKNTNGKSTKESKSIQKSFSDSPLFLLLFVIFITGEWILRKMFGVD